MFGTESFELEEFQNLVDSTWYGFFLIILFCYGIPVIACISNLRAIPPGDLYKYVVLKPPFLICLILNIYLLLWAFFNFAILASDNFSSPQSSLDRLSYSYMFLLPPLSISSII
jgi:hypothetical protein